MLFPHPLPPLRSPTAASLMSAYNFIRVMQVFVGVCFALPLPPSFDQCPRTNNRQLTSAGSFLTVILEMIHIVLQYIISSFHLSLPRGNQTQPVGCFFRLLLFNVPSYPLVTPTPLCLPTISTLSLTTTTVSPASQLSSQLARHFHWCGCRCQRRRSSRVQRLIQVLNELKFFCVKASSAKS